MSDWIYNGVEFRVGDRVKVVCSVEDEDQNGMGAGVKWENGWVHADERYLEMDGFIGHEFEIYDIMETGVQFSEFGYGFPLSCMINLTRRGNLPAI